MQLLTVFLVTISVASISEAAVLGGLSGEEIKPLPKDDPVVTIIPKISSEIRDQVSAKLASSSGSHPDVKDVPITVLAYKKQLVSGMNYFVKANIGKLIFHLRIYKDIQDKVSLTAVDGPKKESDPIVYF